MSSGPAWTLERAAALLSAVLGLAAGAAALRRWGAGWLAWAWGVAVRHDREHGHRAVAVDATRSAFGDPHHALDGCVLEVAERDAQRRPSRTRTLIDGLYAPDVQARSAEIAETRAAADATDRKLDEVLGSVALQRELIAPLRDMPAVVARLDGTIDRWGETLGEIHRELKEHRDGFAGWRETQAARHTETTHALSSLTDAQRDLTDRVDAWDGRERRAQEDSDRRASPARGGGRRDRDHRPA